MDKENMAHEYYSSKNWNSAIFNNMDGPRGYYIETKIAVILEINYSSVKKEKVAYAHNGLFFSHEKEGNTVICNSVDETTLC